MVDQISNVKWLWWRLEQEVKAAGVSEVAKVLGGSTEDIHRRLRTHQVRMKGLVTMANKLFDCSIAEMFLDPAVYTDWYKDARPEYFVENINAAKEEKGCTTTAVAKAVGCEESPASSWFTGKAYPQVETMQKIADYFEMEIADLFLPPKGVVE